MDSTITDINRSYKDGHITKALVKNFLTEDLNWIGKYIERFSQKQTKRDEKIEKILNQCKAKRGEQWCQKKLGKYLNKIYYQLDKIHKKIILIQYQIILKQLDFYRQKKWVDDKGYSIIKNDITWLINDLKN